MSEFIITDEERDEFFTDLYAKLPRYVKGGVGSYLQDTILENDKDVKTFMEKIAHLKIANNYIMQYREVQSTEIDEFNKLLETMRKNEVRMVCPDTKTLIITGDYVSFIDITDSEGNLKYSCPRIEKPRNVYIFAMHTLFIDGNLSLKGRGVENVFVVAPSWVLRGSAIINVDGANGQEYKSPLTKKFINGVDGEPGLPGEPGANFFGIVKEIMKTSNSDKLTISSNGGDGGPGQDSSDSYDPKIDVYNLCSQRETNSGCWQRSTSNEICHDRAEGEDEEYVCPPRDFLEGVMGIKIQQDSYDCSFNDVYQRGQLVLENVFVLDSKFDYTNDERKIAAGGFGGRGADPGAIEVVQLSNSSFISMTTYYGHDGSNGKGGLKRIKPRTRTFNSEPGVTFLSLNVHDNICQIRSSGVSYSTYNRKGLVQPKKIPSESELSVVKEYKKSIIETIGMESSNFKKNIVMEFVELLDDKHIKRGHDLFELYENLVSAEISVDQTKTLNAIPLYESLLKRVEKSAQKLKPGDALSQRKKIHSYYYTLIVSRISYIREQLKTTLIIDTDTYMEVVLDTIQDFSNIENKVHKFELVKEKIERIEEQKTDFNRYLDEKINGVELLTKKLVGEMKVIGKTLDDNIHSLLEKIKKMKEAKQEALQQYKHAREQLKKQMIFKGIASFIRSVSNFLNFIGPYGMAANAAIQVGVSVVESVFFSEEVKVKAPDGLPEGIKKIQKKQEEEEEKDKKEAQDLLEMAIDAISEHKDELKREYEDLSSIKGELEKTKTAKKVKTKLRKVIDRARINLQKRSPRLYGKAAAACGRLGKIADIGTSALAVFDTVEKHKDKIDEVDEFIDQVNDQLKSIGKFEKYIQEKMKPGLDNMLTELQGLEKSLRGKEQGALIVARWQLVKNLRELDAKIQEAVQGFDVKDQFIESIRSLQEVVLTMIELFQQIEIYQERRKLADHISDLASTTVGHITFDTELQNLGNRIELETISNVLLQQYQTVVSAVRQLVFPLGGVFLRNDVLPSTIQTESNFRQRVQTTIEKVKILRAKINIYRSSVTNLDHCLGTGPFSSEHVNTAPFYIWRNGDNREMIRDLLSGKEVEMKADIVNPIGNRFHAVKFTHIGLDFNFGSDVRRKTEIKKKLTYFALHMIHSGDSFYEYRGKIYRMPTESQNLWYYLEKNTDGSPLHVGGVYRKIKKGEFMLSPYTTWKVRLEYLQGDNGIDNLMLQEYADDADVELVGYGLYVTNASERCLKMQVRKYYEDFDVTHLLDTATNPSYKVARPRSPRGKREAMYKPIHFDDNSTFSYATSGASLSASSLINNLAGWMKIQGFGVVARVTSMFTSIPGFVKKGLSDETLETSTSEPDESSVIDQEIFYDAVDDHLVTEMKGMPNKLITDPGTIGKYMIENSLSYASNVPLLSASTEDSFSHPVGAMDGCGLLMISDLLSRSFTGEKYKSNLYRDPLQDRAMNVDILKNRVYEAFEYMDNTYGDQNDNIQSFSGVY